MEVKIKVQNCYSWLRTDNDKLKEALWRALRHRRKNYFHTALYKRGVWDGYDEFFKRQTGRFLTGLLPEVEYALIKHYKIPYQIIDQRGSVDFRFKNIDKNFLTQWRPEGHDLEEMHDYQVDFVNEIINHKRGIVQAPTAAGKTAIMIGILKALPQDCPTLILANKKGLVQQNYDELNMWGFQNVGRLYDKYNNVSTFTCATVQSLHKMQDKLGDIRALVVDEIHDMMSKMPKKYYEMLKSCSVRTAVSATPFKFGGSDKSQKYSVKGYFGPIMETESGDAQGRLNTKQLQERKILATADCFFYPIDTPKIPYEIYLDAVTLGIAENWHFHQVVKRLCQKLSGRTLIVVERIAHGDILQDIIPGAMWVRGEDSLATREMIIDKLKYNKTDTIAIATQGIFNTGINVKVHNLINAAGGKAEHQIIQRLGRGLRKASDKDKLNYYDFIFRINDYLESHSNDRIKILTKEGHNVHVMDEIDF